MFFSIVKVTNKQGNNLDQKQRFENMCKTREEKGANLIEMMKIRKNKIYKENPQYIACEKVKN